MCNLSKGVRDEALREGIKEGMKEGIKEGEQRTTLKTIKTLMKNMSLPAEKAMEAIGVSKEERGHYAALLADEQ